METGIPAEHQTISNKQKTKTNSVKQRKILKRKKTPTHVKKTVFEQRKKECDVIVGVGGSQDKTSGQGNLM